MKTITIQLNLRRLAAISASALVLGLGAVGCSKWSEPFKDAPRSNIDNGQPADLIRFPDGFSNAATKCDHGHRLYVVYHGDSPYGAVANDPSCTDK